MTRETALIVWGWRFGFEIRPVDLSLWPRLMAFGRSRTGHISNPRAIGDKRTPELLRLRSTHKHSPGFAEIWTASLALTLLVAYQIAHRKETTLQVIAPAPRPFAVAPRGRSPLPRTGRPLPRADERWLRIEGGWELFGSAKSRSLSTNRTETPLHDL